ncbi:MAG TPA: hypothetical protein VGO40_17975 [Longimicrobium sp.]|jgi:hypothetical protein|nr:hypothetical protein [Longimicrobium sp.]
MRLTTVGWMVLAATTLSAPACKDQGGELRDVTARRRAELANRDTTRDRPRDEAADTSRRLPAFAGDTAARTPVVVRDSAATDTTRRIAPAGWGVAPRQGGTPNVPTTLRGVRAASNPQGFDRMVLDFGADPVPGWHTAYSARPALACGSGEPVQVEGERWLRVRLQTAQAHDEQGQPTVRQRRLPLGMPVLRELGIACDFEGEVEVVLGVTAANPYRVMELANPTRLVIDIQRQP